MGGDPDPGSSSDVAEAILRGGADMVEIGIPFTDPIADGRSIQAAGVRALASGAKPRDVLGIAAEIKEKRDVPVILMTYFNPVFSNGVGSFLDRARKSGVDGIIVPDLPLDEAYSFGRAARKRGIDSVLLAAPTTTKERMRKIAASTSGFLYLVSVLGVTGARHDLEESTVRLVGFANRLTAGRVPLAVGFGISRPWHVRAVLRAGADAAIVGSSIVDRVGELASGRRGALKRVEGYVRSLKDATLYRRLGSLTR